MSGELAVIVLMACMCAYVWALVGLAWASEGWPRTGARLLESDIGFEGARGKRVITVRYEYDWNGVTHVGERLSFAPPFSTELSSLEKELERLNAGPLSVSVCPSRPSLSTIRAGASDSAVALAIILLVLVLGFAAAGLMSSR